MKDERRTCFRILSSTRSIKASGHGSISGALLSVTHTRVNSCRSRVSRGNAWLSTSAKISSISIENMLFSHYYTLRSPIESFIAYTVRVVEWTVPQRNWISASRSFWHALQLGQQSIGNISTSIIHTFTGLTFSRLSLQGMSKIMMCCFICGKEYLHKAERQMHSFAR